MTSGLICEAVICDKGNGDRSFSRYEFLVTRFLLFFASVKFIPYFFRGAPEKIFHIIVRNAVRNLPFNNGDNVPFNLVKGWRFGDKVQL